MDLGWRPFVDRNDLTCSVILGEDLVGRAVTPSRSAD